MAEFGITETEIVSKSPIFEGIGGVGHKTTILMSHGDTIALLPPFYSKKIKAKCINGHEFYIKINLHRDSEDRLLILSEANLNIRCAKCGIDITTPEGYITMNMIPLDDEINLLRQGKTKKFMKILLKKEKDKNKGL